MLQQIKISNFKRLKEADLSLRRINILVGPNGAGKSSVIQLLAFLKQSVQSEGPLQYSGPYIELHDFSSVVYKHEAPAITLTLDFRLLRRELNRISHALENIREEILRPSEWIKTKRQRRVTLRLELSWNEKGFVGQSAFLNGLLLISNEKREDTDNQFPSDIISTGKVNVSPLNLLCGWNLGGPSDEVQEIQRFIGSLRSIVWSRLNKMQPLLVSRGLTRHQYDLSKDIPREISSVDLHRVGSQVANTLVYMLGKTENEKTLELIVKWASEFGVRIRSNLLADYKISIEGLDDQLQVWSNIALHGFGVNQLLPIIVQGSMMNPQSVLLVEEPEIHLHPKHQAKLVDFFLDISSRSKQVLITTHSEHIILRLQRRVAEGKIRPRDLRIYYFDNLKGETRITRIKLDQYGSLQTWVPGFFEEGFEESLAQLRASLEKAKKASQR